MFYSGTWTILWVVNPSIGNQVSSLDPIENNIRPIWNHITSESRYDFTIFFISWTLSLNISFIVGNSSFESTASPLYSRPELIKVHNSWICSSGRVSVSLLPAWVYYQSESTTNLSSNNYTLSPRTNTVQDFTSQVRSMLSSFLVPQSMVLIHYKGIILLYLELIKIGIKKNLRIYSGFWTACDTTASFFWPPSDRVCIANLNL